MAKGKKANKPRVSEDTRIHITRTLEQFRANRNRQVYTFEENLSNVERAVVHQMCKKMGMKSKSSGLGEQRKISVYKVDNKKGTSNKNESIPSFTFSEKSQMALDNLFSTHPPNDGELCVELEPVGEHRGNVGKTQGNKNDIFCKPTMNKGQIAKKLELLDRLEKDTKTRKLLEDRAKLPITSFKDVVTSTVESNQVVLISGETGCGKTTQVPQFLLDHMWGKGEACKIVCTQPRRISATSVAERIAYERGQHVGQDIGYKIRLETKGGQQSSIVFCTNGILLRVLVSRGNVQSKNEASNKSLGDDVSNITHIIVDEVHERDRYSDFLLAIIRDLLPSYPHLRLILMSATLDSGRFSQYFGGCPVVSVPGFTYPVKSFYLEDVLSILKSTNDNHLDSFLSAPNEEQDLTEEDKATLDEAISLSWSNDEFDPLLDLISSKGTSEVYDYQHSLTGFTPLMVFAGKGREDEVCLLLSFGVNCHLKNKDGLTALELAERENQEETAEILKDQVGGSLSNSNEQQELLDKYLSTIDPELIDVVLIEHLLKKICMDSKDGAILVFLPGWDDINKIRERLTANPFFRSPSKFVIISLHSMVPSAEQKKVFKRCSPGCRKIVLSTNIAETAITIDDVIYVIDSGRMKEKNYDPYSNVSTLQSSWISKANAKQREGRAGRCQPGICYHLYSKLRMASLPEFQVPEIKRMPIEELCLQVKLLDPNCRIEEFLLKTLDPPISETIQNAVVVLQDIGALSPDENLTELGEKLGFLPVHPLTSKMLFFAVLMKCLDPALTLACASDYRDPFTLPLSPVDKKRAQSARLELASMYGGHSDQLAVIAAFEFWNIARQRGLEARFCSEYFVSSSTMQMLHHMREQLKSELSHHGFIEGDVSRYSSNSHDPGILHAVLVAGLYPNVGRLLPPKNGKRAVVETPSGAKVRLHPRSLNFKLSLQTTGDCPLVMYDEITRGDGGMHIKNCTIFSSLPLLLLSTEMSVAPPQSCGDDNNVDDDDDDSEDDETSDEDAEEVESDNNDMDVDCNLNKKGVEKIMSSPDNLVTVVVDRWLYFSTTAIVAAQVYCLRERLSAAILYKVKHPRNVVPSHLAASLYAMACVLSYDGQSGLSLPKESVDLSTSMIRAAGLDMPSPISTRTGGSPYHFQVPLMCHRTMPQVIPSNYNLSSAQGFNRKSNDYGIPTASSSFQLGFQRQPLLQGSVPAGYNSATQSVSVPTKVPLQHQQRRRNWRGGNIRTDKH